MEMPKNYDETIPATGEYETLEVGGYICKIVNAKEEISKNGNKMLAVAFDIAEGDHKDIYQRRFTEQKLTNPEAKWSNNGIHRIMLLDKDGQCNKFFKGFITSVENSNQGYNFKESKFDEKTLKGKLFGGVFGEEEYLKSDGKIGTITKLRWIRTTGAIEDGKYNIPDKKVLNQSTQSNYNSSNDDDDLPF